MLRGLFIWFLVTLTYANQAAMASDTIGLSLWCSGLNASVDLRGDGTALVWETSTVREPVLPYRSGYEMEDGEAGLWAIFSEPLPVGPDRLLVDDGEWRDPSGRCNLIYSREGSAIDASWSPLLAGWHRPITQNSANRATAHILAYERSELVDAYLDWVDRHGFRPHIDERETMRLCLLAQSPHHRCVWRDR